MCVINYIRFLVSVKTSFEAYYIVNLFMFHVHLEIKYTL